MGGYVLEQGLRRSVGVVGVCGFSEFVGIRVAGLDGVWVGGPSLHGSGRDVDGCCEGGFWCGWSSWFIVGQGLVHVFSGYVCDAEMH